MSLYHSQRPIHDEPVKKFFIFHFTQRVLKQDITSLINQALVFTFNMSYINALKGLITTPIISFFVIAVWIHSAT